MAAPAARGRVMIGTKFRTLSAARTAWRMAASKDVALDAIQSAFPAAKVLKPLIREALALGQREEASRLSLVVMEALLDQSEEDALFARLRALLVERDPVGNLHLGVEGDIPHAVKPRVHNACREDVAGFGLAHPVDCALDGDRAKDVVGPGNPEAAPIPARVFDAGAAFENGDAHLIKHSHSSSVVEPGVNAESGAAGHAAPDGAA